VSEPLPILEPEATSQAIDADEERWSIHLGLFGKTPPFTKRR
jgi:hypothetical protein